MGDEVTVVIEENCVEDCKHSAIIIEGKSSNLAFYIRRFVGLGLVCLVCLECLFSWLATWLFGKKGDPNLGMLV